MFPNSYIYQTRMTQGIELPCFFVTFVKSEITKILSFNKKYTLHFMIAYKYASDVTVEEIYAIESKLKDLNVISNENFRCRVINIEASMQEGELQVLCSVNLRKWSVTTDELMQNAELEEEIKQHE